MPKFSHNGMPRRLLLIGGGIAVAVVLLAGFRVLRFCLDRIAGDFFYPYLELARRGTDRLSDLTLLGYSRRELAAKVEELQQSSRQLALQSANAAELLRENQQLRRLVRLEPPEGWNQVVGEIILRDPLLWGERFTVNRGTEHGVRPGSAVLDVSPDGRPLLVGIVDEAGRHSSRVITLFDPELRISGRLTTAGTVGIINFSERRPTSGRITIGLLPAHLHYLPGEAVVSTGFERNLPPGILIGTLNQADVPGSIYSNVLQVSGTLTPAADPSRLRFPVILTATRDTP